VKMRASADDRPDEAGSPVGIKLRYTATHQAAFPRAASRVLMSINA
jgi:hypothetical protein